MKRRDFVKLAAGGATTLMPRSAMAQRPADLLQYLCPPDSLPDQLTATPSPPARPFEAELYVMPVKTPVDSLDPPAEPRAHQLYERYPPRALYELREQEFRWRYHPDPPYDQGTWSWGFDGATPGPTFHSRYRSPALVRIFNELPPVGASKVTFAMPSTTTHLHNFHTASESDGGPQDWIDSGEFWDHHYCNFPSGQDPREALTTLWYHDHRMDFTAANVYAGLSGFHLLFDEQDSGNENDPNPAAWRLPSGTYDVPLIFHDVKFRADGQVVFNNFYTDGWLGDQVTINRRIRPRFTVERRKYRFRILNGGPSRFYQLSLDSGDPFVVITGDGNFLREPVLAKQLLMSVAQRFDVIIDFSRYQPGEQVVLQNTLEQVNGKGPSGATLEPPDGVLRFDVVESTGPDNSRIPDFFRDLPPLPPNVDELVHRTWDFDYDGGIWTINKRVMDGNRIDAGVAKGSAEVWTFRNTGNTWSHPIHCHFTEFLILEINGRPYDLTTRTGRGGGSLVQQIRADGRVVYIDTAGDQQIAETEVFFGGPRRDVATILPGDVMKVLMRFEDFEGRYVMHCHNVVHEDHAMMIRWDILPEGTAPIREPVDSRTVWGEDSPFGRAGGPEHLEERPSTSTPVATTRGRGNVPPNPGRTPGDR